MSIPSLPAATTKSMPAWPEARITSSSAWLKPPPPQLLLVTRTFTPVARIAVAYSRHSIASDVQPLPSESRNLSAMIRTFQLTPATPIPLSPTAPIVPATWVPW